MRRTLFLVAVLICGFLAIDCIAMDLLVRRNLAVALAFLSLAALAFAARCFTRNAVATQALAQRLSETLAAHDAEMTAKYEAEAEALAKNQALTQALRVEMEGARQALRTMTEGLRMLAGGDLAVRLADAMPSESAVSGQIFDQAMTLVTKAMLAFDASLGVIRAQSQTLIDGANSLSYQTDSRAEKAEDVAQALQALSCELRGETPAQEGLAPFVPKIAASAAGARTGGAALAKLAATGGRIAEITTLIDEVSFQTNLLALNAGVEAARAGEAGRGIAVVAQELRALSARSTQAAKDLGALLRESLRDARAESQAVLEAAQTLEALAPHIETSQRFVKQVRETGLRHSQTLAERAKELSALVENMKQDQAIKAETKAASLALEDLLRKLSGLLEHFRFENKDLEDRDAYQPPRLALTNRINNGNIVR